MRLLLAADLAELGEELADPGPQEQHDQDVDGPSSAEVLHGLPAMLSLLISAA